jgi:hypothetical protein
MRSVLCSMTGPIPLSQARHASGRVPAHALSASSVRVLSVRNSRTSTGCTSFSDLT